MDRGQETALWRSSTGLLQSPQFLCSYERSADTGGRGGRCNKQERRVCIGRGGGSSAMAIPLGDIFRGGNKASESIEIDKLVPYRPLQYIYPLCLRG